MHLAYSTVEMAEILNLLGSFISAMYWFKQECALWEYADKDISTPFEWE